MPKNNLSNPCSSAIQKTLAYTSVFKYPLTFYQLSNYLVTRKVYDYGEFSKQLKGLVSRGYIKEKKGKYSLPGIKNIDWESRKTYSEKLIKKNIKTLKLLQSVPWIKLICITGSVANYNATKGDDVDLMFVTSKNRLWLTRGFVFSLLAITHKLSSDEKKREICPNIFIDESNLSWSKKQRNLYVAQNIASSQPIYSKDNMYFKFLTANSWIHRYVANFQFNSPKELKNNRIPSSTIVDVFEILAYKMQTFYMKKKQTKEVTTRKLIHFNKNDSAYKTLKTYNSVLKNRKIS